MIVGGLDVGSINTKAVAFDTAQKRVIGRALLRTELDPAELTAIARRAYEEHAADYRAALTVEQRRQMMTAEDVAWFHEQARSKAKPTAVTPTAAPVDRGDGRDDRGRYAERTSTDQNGRKVVRSVSEAIGGSWTMRR